MLCGRMNKVQYKIKEKTRNIFVIKNDKKYIMDSFWIQEHKNRCLYNIYL